MLEVEMEVRKETIASNNDLTIEDAKLNNKLNMLTQ